MAIERLTDRAVRAAKPAISNGEKRTPKGTAIPKFYSDGKGLLLRVGPTGSKSWVFRYTTAGKVHDMGLGPYPERSLADARDLAMAQRRLRLDGKDPLAENGTKARRRRIARTNWSGAAATSSSTCSMTAARCSASRPAAMSRRS